MAHCTFVPDNQLERCPLLQLQPLLKLADAVGDLLLYRHQGFLPNKRQLRSGGLAAIELAQVLRAVVSRLPCTWKRFS